MRAMLTGAALGVVLGGLAVGASSIGWSESGSAHGNELSYRQLELFSDVLSRTRAEYVEDIDDAEVIEAAINGMLTSLDPHSGYLAPEDFRAMQVNASGEYGGLGIEVTMEDGFLKIVTPMDDTPASRADLQSGDLITAVDGAPIIGQSVSDAVKNIRGEVGSDILLTIMRTGAEPFDVTLTREVIRPKSVTWRDEGNDVAYIRVSTFNDKTTDLLDQAIDEIEAEMGNPAGILLDLRNNGGGLLDQAVSVSDTFLSGGEVVSTQGRRQLDVERYNARSGEQFRDIPMVVLINEGSASASEIVAGALQDRGRARVLGMTSFGKGSVQTVIPLGAEKGAIRLTTARYYTPAGRSIQSTGIEPDIEVANRIFTEEDMAARRRWTEADLPNALDNEEGSERRAAHMPLDQPPEDYDGEDYQLERAMDVLLGEDRRAETPNAG
ncbi:MAG: S41 family peptidase [Pseudomonadota bacterium]